MSPKVKNLATIAMLSALAYVVMFFAQMLPPLVPNPPLRYDPKDVIIIIGGFIYGPFTVIAMSVVVSLIEMITVSTTGPYGLLMNIVSTCAFAFPAAVIYNKKRTITGAVIGLISGVVLVVGVMLLWNYIITPIYLVATIEELPFDVSQMRENVAGMLIPVFLPFNLLKASLNAAFIMLIYKPLSDALRKMRMLPETDEKSRANIGVLIASLFAVLTCVLLTLVFMGVI